MFSNRHNRAIDRSGAGLLQEGVVLSSSLGGVALGVVVGAAVGAAGAVLFGPQIARHARPAAKAALKAALVALQEAQIRGAEFTEAAEDLYAEAKAEAATTAAPTATT